MREIKFRAWFIQQKEMLKIWLQIKHGILHQGDENCIIMQYTGLKDEEGTEIYEGDIIEYFEVRGPGLSETRRCVVSWDNLAAGFYGIEEEGEIIGNIYENPELIEGDE